MNTKKGQHYLLTAKARSLSLMEIMRLSEEEAFELFKKSRWTDEEPVCPVSSTDRCNTLVKSISG